MTLRPRLALAALGAACLLPAVTSAASADDDFARCLASLKPAAQAAGVQPDTWDRHTRSLSADLTVIDKLNYQPEFRMPIWDYLAGLVDDERVMQGRALLAQHRAVLAQVQQRYGVDPATVVAVWGVESNFGQTFGKYPLLQALGTLSCLGRRQGYFRGELFAALRIVQAGHVAPERLVGSWAGAFGHTQFMPTTYERLAVDFDGDGRRDLIDSVPDALASTANFLARAGWQGEQPWGIEVRLPAGFSTAGQGRTVKHALTHWRTLGLTRTDGSPLPDSGGPFGLLTPAGAQGPAFLVGRNFDAIYSYNAAESYGLAIAHLSDRLRGGGPFATPWPTDDPGLSRAERRDLQRLLVARGHDIGEIDGLLGDRSRVAIKVEQTRLGFTADGRAGQKLLSALRQDTPLPADPTPVEAPIPAPASSTPAGT